MEEYSLMINAEHKPEWFKQSGAGDMTGEVILKSILHNWFLPIAVGK